MLHLLINKIIAWLENPHLENPGAVWDNLNPDSLIQSYAFKVAFKQGLWGPPFKFSPGTKPLRRCTNRQKHTYLDATLYVVAYIIKTVICFISFMILNCFIFSTYDYRVSPLI